MMKPNPITPDFPLEEYTKYRWKKARELMQKNNLDALMVTDNANWYWFLGYDPGSMKMRPNILILPREGDPAAFICLGNKNMVLKSTYVTNIKGYIDAPFIIEEFSDFLKKMGLFDARIGCEIGQDQRLGVSFLDFIKLRDDLLPKAKFVDAAAILWDLVLVKTSAELERIRKACKISDEAYVTWREQLFAGVSQQEASSMLMDAMKDQGGDVGHVTLDNMGRNSPMDRPFKKGDIMWLDFGAKYKGYMTDYSRRLSFGEPSELQKKHHELIWRVTLKEIEAIKPGVKCSEVFEVMQQEMMRLGIPRMDPRKRAGHGMGLESVPPSINAYDHTILKPGMVLTPEPRFEAKYGRVHAEETVLVTDEGCEILTKAPRDFYVIKN